MGGGYTITYVATELVSGLSDAAGQSLTIGNIVENAGGKLADVGTFSGFSADYIGATGLFTALIIGIGALEIYGLFRKMDALKIKMPDQVPPGVARAFEILIPTFLTLLCVGIIGWAVQLITGSIS